MSNNSFFDKIEKKTNVNPDDLLQIAHSISQEDLKNERTIRHLIAQLSMIAGKNISKENEDQIVNAILNDQMPMDFASLAKMLKN